VGNLFHIHSRLFVSADAYYFPFILIYSSTYLPTSPQDLANFSFPVFVGTPEY